MKYKVKVTVAPSDKERLQRQLPGKLGVWKNFQQKGASLDFPFSVFH